MAAGFEDYLAGAGSGALAGASLGPWGAVAGGVLGLIGASQKKDPQEYHDPFEQQRLAAANDMQHSKLGEETAGYAASKIKQNALDSYEGIRDNPNFQNNASVQSAAYGKAMRGAESGIVGAQLGGAAMDQATHERGAEMLSGIQKSNYQSYLNNQAVNNQPTALDTIAQSGLSYLGGKGAEKLGGGGPKGPEMPSFDPSGSIPYPLPQSTGYFPTHLSPIFGDSDGGQSLPE